MQPPKNKWPATPAGRGTLFFAQSMRAFLDPGAHEGFRAYSLDTLARLKEAHALTSDIKLKRINRAALAPVLAELVWSIESDDAATRVAGDEFILLLSMCKSNNIDIDNLIHAIQMVVSRLYPGYREALKDRVVELLQDDRSRIDLLKATGFLASHLVMMDIRVNF